MEIKNSIMSIPTTHNDGNTEVDSITIITPVSSEDISNAFFIQKTIENINTIAKKCWDNASGADAKNLNHESLIKKHIRKYSRVKLENKKSNYKIDVTYDNKEDGSRGYSWTIKIKKEI